MSAILMTVLVRRPMNPALMTTVVTLASAGISPLLRRIRASRRRAAADGARVIEIALPAQVEQNGAAAFWANMLGLHRPRLARLFAGQPHVAMEYVLTARQVAVRLWVPGTVPPGLVEHAVEAAWPGAHAAALPLPISPLPPAGPRGAVDGGRLVPGRTHALPLRTKHETDPLRPLLGAAAHLRHGHGACVQILAKPAGARRCAQARRSLRALQGKNTATLKSVIFDSMTRPGVRRVTTSMMMDHRLEADARAAAAKLAGPLYEVEIRYAAAVPAPENSDSAGHKVHPATRALARGVCHEIASTLAVHAERNYLRRRRLHEPEHYISQRIFTRGALYSIPELAALAHLPWDPNALGLSRAQAKPVPPAPTIPDGAGLKAAKVLGDADTGLVRPVALNVADARHHLHVLGATGSGKSTLLVDLLLQDIAAGLGAVVIDPQGDMIADILDRLPASALTRPLYLFDPCDSATPVPRLNILDGPGADLAVDHLVSIFKRVYSAYWGPRSDDLVRASALTLLTAKASKPSLPVPTLGSIPAILSSDQERRRYTDALDRAAKPVLRGFWDWYTGLSEPARAQITAPLMNKLRAFLMRDYPAGIVASGATNIDLNAVLDGGLLLARLPKGVLGEETTRLLGSLLLATTWQAATTRSVSAHRRDAAVYVDEAHEFLNLAVGVETMLAQARALRVGLTLAHQNLGQLPAEMNHAVSANARSKIYFNASPEDARHLARHTAPAISELDLSRLGAYQAAARLVVDAAVQPACTLATRPLPPVIPGRALQAREHAAESLMRKAR
ncbi:type IV secretory system conjugative DNA transfer family protein [Actinospica robiniae]|uniref:type IV secretory system conjugative DNA transfer family protein n=1 Tax=Actinospica robiniae TaxID=304901 RepID=UPI0004001AED|nr:DUF87 domain-containing protein [Actinospica robiniae]